MLVFKYGSMPLDVAQDSLQLFAREVLLAAQAIPSRSRSPTPVTSQQVSQEE